MQRYFLENDEYENGKIEIRGDDFHHIVRVMRMTVGSKIDVVFPNGQTAICEIANILPDVLEAKVVSVRDEVRELPIKVTVAGGLLKGDKFDIVVQKGTEMGAAAFLPFTSERSVVKLEEKKRIRRMERWQKIAKEAAEQSERTMIPKCLEPVSFQELLLISQSYEKKIVAYEEEGRNHHREQLPQTLKELQAGEALLFVFGPEGGFSKAEIDALKANDFIVCGLGPRILRAETAPLYALAAISFYFELLR